MTAPRRPGRASPVARIGLGAGALLAIVVFWDALVRLSIVPSFILPAPAAVVEAGYLFLGPLLDATRVTLTEVLAGFGLAVAVAAVLAVSVTYSQTLNAIIYPPLLALQAVPKVAVAPLLIVWFGFGITSKIVIAFLIAFFPIVIQTAVGLRTVEPQLHDLSRVYGAGWWRTFRKIDFPHSLPSFFAGLKVGITLAVTGAIVGEFLSAESGLGFLLQSAVAHYRLGLAFAAVFFIGVMSMALFGAVVLLEKLIVPWRTTSKA